MRLFLILVHGIFAVVAQISTEYVTTPLLERNVRDTLSICHRAHVLKARPIFSRSRRRNVLKIQETPALLKQ